MFERPREFMRGLIAAARGDEFPEEQQGMTPITQPIRMLRPDGQEQQREHYVPRQVVPQQEVDDGEYDEQQSVVDERGHPEKQVPLEAHHRSILEEHGIEESGSHDAFMRRFKLVAVFLLTPVLWVVLGWGNAQLYSSFAPFEIGNGFVALMYLAGFAYEGGTLALIFAAALRWRKRDRSGAGITMFFAILMSLFSLFTQWAFVAYEVHRHILDWAVVIAMYIPVSVGFIIFFRAVAPTVLSFALVFILPEKTLNVDERIAEKRKLQKAVRELEQDEQERELREMQHEHEMEEMKQFLDYRRGKQTLLSQHVVPNTSVVYVHDTPQLPEHIYEEPPANTQKPSASQTSLPEQIAHPHNRHEKPVTSPTAHRTGNATSAVQKPSETPPVTKENMPVEKRSTVRMNGWNEIKVEPLDDDTPFTK